MSFRGALGVAFVLAACSSTGNSSLGLVDAAGDQGADAGTSTADTPVSTDEGSDIVASPDVTSVADVMDAVAPMDVVVAPDGTIDMDASAMEASAMDASAMDASAMDVSNAVDSPDATAVDAPDAGPVCVTSTDCPAGSTCCTSHSECPVERPVCRGGVCGARVDCTSSRTCPGEVCDPVAMSCVRCVADNDCETGERCVAYACVPSRSCRSSAQCSAFNMVCDTVSERCVDCVIDADCGAGSFCNASNLCRRQVCTPSSANCVDLMTRRSCDMRGSALTTTPCASGQSCVDGSCAMRTCAPGATECVDSTRVRTCRSTGIGFNDPVECPVGQSCSSGACVPRVCTPDAPAGCADTTGERLCTADGLGYRRVACSAVGANTEPRCSPDRCAFTCRTGYASCDAMDSNGCEVNTNTSLAHCGGCNRPCGAGQNCVNGACATRAICPSSCAVSADCDPCRAPGDPVESRYCCISGLCIFMTGSCVAPGDSGVTDVGMSDVSSVDSGT